MSRVCDVSEVPNESLKKFTVDGKEICVGKHNGKLFACENMCPHRFASMDKGWFDGDNVVCHIHYFQFSIDTGKLEKIDEKWKEQSAAWKKSDDLTMYDVEVKDDEIFLEPRRKII